MEEWKEEMGGEEIGTEAGREVIIVTVKDELDWGTEMDGVERVIQVKGWVRVRAYVHVSS